MCRYRSGIAVRHGDDVELLTLPDDDSHANIRQHHGVPEDIGGIAGRETTPVEFVPHGSLDSIEEYDLIYDAGKPDWVTDIMDAKLRREFERVVQQDIAANQITRHESLDLCNLQSLPENMRIEARFNIDIRRLRSLPENVQIKTGGNVDLRCLQSMSENVRIEARRYIDLHDLTSLPENARIEAGDSVCLSSLRSLSENVQIEAKENIDLHNLRSVSENVHIVAGDRLNLSNLRSLSENAQIVASRVYANGQWYSVLEFREMLSNPK